MKSVQHGSLLYSAIARGGLLLIAVAEFFVSRFSADQRFFEPEDFEWTRKMESAFPAVKSELLQVLKDYEKIPEFKDLSEEQARIVKGNKWRSFFLFVYGEEIEKNCARCPVTTRAAGEIPGMITAFFSILEPGTKLAEHRGPYKGVLRYHLALIVPPQAEGCGLRVAGETRHWQEGKSLVFDDSFPHEAWNATEEMRAVLFVDVVRPLPFPVSLMNRAVIFLLRKSPFIQKVVARI